MKIRSLRAFFRDLINFLNFLIVNYNKNYGLIMEIDNIFYVNTMSNSKKAEEMWKKQVKDILLKGNESNDYNYNLINWILNSERNDNNKYLKDVLSATTEYLHNIYINKKSHKDDFYKDFKRFQDYYSKEGDEEKREIIKYKGENFEKAFKEEDIKPGPKKKAKK